MYQSDLPKLNCENTLTVLVEKMSSFPQLTFLFYAIGHVPKYTWNDDQNSAGARARAVKRAGGPWVGPLNPKNFRVRVLVFSVRLNSGFFGRDQASARSYRASPRLTDGPNFFFFSF